MECEGKKLVLRLKHPRRVQRQRMWSICIAYTELTEDNPESKNQPSKILFKVLEIAEIIRGYLRLPRCMT